MISTSSPEKQAVEVVKKWYRRHGHKAPQRIVVHQIRDNRCMLTAGQENIETGFEVDLKQMKVLRVIPGQ